MPATPSNPPASDHDLDLSERARHLFRVLVERHIRDGKPVGSRTLSRDSGLELSPATIRNVMADLEEAGLLRSPHTSAGRVPTASGYRLFVDTLLKVEPLHGDEAELLREQLAPAQDRSSLMEAVSSLLSEVTSLAGVVTLPRQDQVTLRQVEFLSLSDEQVLVIMVVNEREVQNRVIATARRYTDSELQQAGNYLTSLCGGLTLMQVRSRVLEELSAHREKMNTMMQAAVDMARSAFDDPGDADNMLVAGQTNLMNYGELSETQKLRELFEAFSRKRDILYLLDQSLGARGLQIFIGDESGFGPLDECSVVTSPYEVDGQVLGVLGVIGPTRMAYDRVIPVVDMTARLLGAALNKSH